MYYYENDTTIRGNVEEIVKQLGADFNIFMVTAFEEENITDILEMIKTAAYSKNTAPLHTFIEKIHERACKMAEYYEGLVYVNDESEIPDNEEEEEE